MSSPFHLHLIGQTGVTYTDPTNVTDGVRSFLLSDGKGSLHVGPAASRVRRSRENVHEGIEALLANDPYVSRGQVLGPTRRGDYFMSIAPRKIDMHRREEFVGLLEGVGHCLARQSFEEFNQLYAAQDWDEHIAACLCALNAERTHVDTANRQFTYAEQKNRVWGQCAEFVFMVAVRAMLKRFDASGKMRIHSKEDGDVSLSDEYSLRFKKKQYSCYLIMRHASGTENLGEQDLIVKTPEGYLLIDVTLSIEHLKRKLECADGANLQAVGEQLWAKDRPVDLQALHVFCGDRPRDDLPPSVASFPARELTKKVLVASLRDPHIAQDLLVKSAAPLLLEHLEREDDVPG